MAENINRKEDLSLGFYFKRISFFPILKYFKNYFIDKKRKQLTINVEDDI